MEEDPQAVEATEGQEDEILVDEDPIIAGSQVGSAGGGDTKN